MNKDNSIILLYLNILELSKNKEIDLDILKKQYTKLYIKYHPSITTNDKYKDGKQLNKLNEAYKYLKDNISYVNSLIKTNTLSSIDIDLDVIDKNKTIKKEKQKVNTNSTNTNISTEPPKEGIKVPKKLILKILSLVAIVVLILSVCLVLTNNTPEKRIDDANDLIEDKQYDQAEDKLKDLDTDEAKKLLEKIEALRLLEQGLFDEAIEKLKQLGEVIIDYELDGGQLNKDKLLDYVGQYFPAEKEGYEFEDYIVAGYELIENGIKVLLEAVYSQKPNNIYYELDGGEQNIKNPNEYDATSNDIEIYSPSKEGYTFLGWTTDLNLPPQINYIIQQGTTGEITLYAIWQPNQYQIIFRCNGGQAIENYTVTMGEYYNLPTPIKTGYKFLGWYYGSSYMGSGYWKIPSDATVEAKWEAEKYKLILTYNDGEVIHSSQVTYKFDQAFTVTTPTRPGYTFLGWFYDNDKQITSSIWKFTKDIRAEAKWQANEYEIEFDTNGGSMSQSSSMIVYYDSNVELPTPTKQGHEFLGWYYNDELISSGKWTYDTNMELQAKWNQLQFTITFIDGDNVSQQLVTYGQNYTLPPLTKPGYTFLGWYDNQNNKYIDGIWLTKSDVRLTAIWQKN